MTARPLEIERQLAEQERRVAGSDGEPRRCVPCSALIDNVRSLWNVGAIFRSADGCGLERLVLTGITGHPPRKEISKTALGAEQAVAWEYRAEAIDALRDYREAGYRTVALELSDRAEPLDRYDWTPKSLLVVGNEVAGVSDPLLQECQDHISIPMLGAKNSFNVAVAFGIAAFSASRALVEKG